MTVHGRLVDPITDIQARVRRLAQLNRELLAAETKERGGRFGGAIGVFVGAGLLGVYAGGFLLATVAVLLDLVLPLWAAMLIVSGALVVAVAVFVAVGRSLLEKAGKPMPEEAVAEGKKTAELVRDNVRMTVDHVRAKVTAGGTSATATAPFAAPPHRSAPPAEPPPAEPPPGTSPDAEARTP